MTAVTCPRCQASVEPAAPACPACGTALDPPRPAGTRLEPIQPVTPPPAPASVLLAPGTQFDARYEVVRLIGKGAMASVYLVRHLALQSQHALKVLSPELALDEDLRARFVAEGRIQAQLKHPHIVQVTEIVTAPVCGLVMDYVEGTSLDAWLRGRPPPRAGEALELLGPVLDAVEAAHRFGVVHRDLKPENILVGQGPGGRPWPRVTDFGIAKVASAALAGSARKTAAGMRMGTLLYMSPEQVRGADQVDARSDVFALGAILYEVVTGRVAFDAKSEFDTMKAIVEGSYTPPERVVGGLGRGLGSAIRKALAVSPAERFQSAAEFRAALERAAQEPDRPVAERPSRSFAVTEKPTPVDPRHLPEGAPTFGRARTAEPPARLEALPGAQVLVAQAQPARPARLRPPQPTHLAFAVFSMLFCCFPLGLVGVLYALKASSKNDLHDPAGARASASSGLTWSWLAFGAGSLGWWYLIHQVVHALR